MNKELAKKIREMLNRAIIGVNNGEELNRRLIETLNYIEGYADGVLQTYKDLNK